MCGAGALARVRVLTAQKSQRGRSRPRYTTLKSLLHDQLRWNLPRLIPQGQFHPVPQSQFVVNHAQIILNHVLRGPDFTSDFTVLQALGNELDDSLLAFTGDTGPITSI
jgi:hypothetical protein